MNGWLDRVDELLKKQELFGDGDIDDCFDYLEQSRAEIDRLQSELELVTQEKDEAKDNAVKLINETQYEYNRKTNLIIRKHSEEIESYKVDLQALEEQIKWHYNPDEPFPTKGRYLVKFWLDQGMGHGHYEELLCEHDPEYGDGVILRPNFEGVGFPSIVAWYGPIPES